MNGWRELTCVACGAAFEQCGPGRDRWHCYDCRPRRVAQRFVVDWKRAALASILLPGRCVCSARVVLVKWDWRFVWVDPDTGLPCTHGVAA